MEYQNIFTQVQVQGPPEMGMDPTGDIARERTNKAGFSKLAGILGNAQLGPLHLGMFGVVSLATGLLWFFIVGLNFGPRRIILPLFSCAICFGSHLSHLQKNMVLAWRL